MRFIIIILLLASCNPARKASNYVRGHPDLAAEICADLFPVRETLIKGDTITVVDTIVDVLALVDTTIIRDTVRLTTTRTVTRVVTNTIRDTLRVRDNARVAELESILDNNSRIYHALHKENETYKARLKGKVLIPWYWLVIAGLLFTGSVYFNFKK